MHLLRKKAEAKINSTGKPQAETGHSYLEHELSVHEIELEMQHEELQAANARLKVSVLEYEELFEFSPVCYFILDKEGKIQKLNKKACEKLQKDKEHIIGVPFSTLLNGEILQDEFYRHRSLVFETMKLQRINSEIMRKDGSIIYVAINSLVVKDENNLFKHFLLIVNDVSAIIEREKLVELDLEKATELNEIKSRFINLASHEFRTPLTTVLSSAWLAEQHFACGQETEAIIYLNKIKASVKQIKLILDEFMSDEMLQSDAVKVFWEVFDLPFFCEGLVSDIRISFNARDSLSYVHTGDTSILSDKKVLYHVLSNLLMNAVKYSVKQVDVKVSSEVKNGMVTIKVSDNGIGIPKTEQPFIFNRFYRGKNALKFQGTGLGLSISKEYLKLLNGTIRFESRVGKGSTFIIEFPVT